MAALHTAADPPNHGKMILAIRGCTWKSRKALRKIVVAERIIGVARYLRI
jgi:hypothetical protein